MEQLVDGIVREGAFGRFFIFHCMNDHLAWSGSRWVACTPEGLCAPPDNIQVCNFATKDEAHKYILDHSWGPPVPE